MIQVNYPLPYTLQTSLPSTGYDGQLVLNTTNSTLYFWLNDQWNPISGTTVDTDFDFMDGTQFSLMDDDAFVYMDA